MCCPQWNVFSSAHEKSPREHRVIERGESRPLETRPICVNETPYPQVLPRLAHAMRASQIPKGAAHTRITPTDRMNITSVHNKYPHPPLPRPPPPPGISTFFAGQFARVARYQRARIISFRLERLARGSQSSGLCDAFEPKVIRPHLTHYNGS